MRRPLPVRGSALHHSPDFFASSAYAKSGPRYALWASPGGIHKPSVYKASPTPNPNPDNAKGTAKNSGERCKQGQLARATDNSCPARNLGARYTKKKGGNHGNEEHAERRRNADHNAGTGPAVWRRCCTRSGPVRLGTGSLAQSGRG